MKYFQMWPSQCLSAMVTVKTELFEPDLNIKQEPQSQPTVRTNHPAERLIDLADETDDLLQDMINKEQVIVEENEASHSKEPSHVTDIHDKRGEKIKEDLISERSNEIVDKSSRKEITEGENVLSKKVEKKSTKSTKKKVANLRLVRKEGFFTINPNKIKMKTLERTGQNKNTSSR